MVQYRTSIIAIIMVVSIQSDTWFDSLVHHCLLQRLQPDGFFSELCQAALEERHLQEEGGFNLHQKLQELCSRFFLKKYSHISG